MDAVLGVSTTMTGEYRDFGYKVPGPGNGDVGSELAERFVSLTLGLNGLQRVCDLGCGNGYLASRLGASGLKVTGIDASESGLALARRYYENNDVNFVCAQINSELKGLLYENSRFDAVVSSDVIEHLYRPAALIEAAASLLKPGGYLIVGTPYHGYMKNLAISVLDKWDSHHGVDWDGGHIKFFSVRTLRNLVMKHGFCEANFYFYGRLPLLWKLTFNEAPNIGRTLQGLLWAKEVIIVDSFSTDETVAIASQFSNVRVVQRNFDDHAHQWNFGIQETGIETEWVLALDADYVVSKNLLSEIQSLRPEMAVAGYRASFRYCIEGIPLRATVYTPVTVLFRRERAEYDQDGHTQRVKVDGRINELSEAIFHDDRKSLSRWVASQDRYMRLEAEKLINSDWSSLSWTGRIRKFRFAAPFAMLFYCLLVKGLVLDGRAGICYSFQRVFAELLLSLHLLQNDLLSQNKAPK
jgi:SAM-dependent methyltransferase